MRFIAVGAVSTIAYVAFYLLLRNVLGAQGGNAAALFVIALGNTAANRRITFGVRGCASITRHQIQGVITFGAGLALTSAALAALHEVSPQPARATEVVVLLGASVLATLVKFTLFRQWVFRRIQDPRDGRHDRGGGEPVESATPVPPRQDPGLEAEQVGFPS